MHVNLTLRQNGFTLVEMLVALAIFAMISVAGVSLLQGASRAQLSVKERLGQLGAQQRAISLLENDLAQAVVRSPRNESGLRLPAFATGRSAGEDASSLFSFTRMGWSNIDNSARPELQRVRYDFADGELRRLVFTMPDGAAPQSTVLFSDLKAVTAKFRDKAGVWSELWNPETGDILPRAVNVTLTPENGAPLRLVMLVAGGDGVAAKPKVLTPDPSENAAGGNGDGNATQP